MGTYKHSSHTNGFMQIPLLVLGILVLAGALAWSLAVLPKAAQQGELGAGIEKGIGKGLDKELDQEIEKQPQKQESPEKQEPKAEPQDSSKPDSVSKKEAVEDTPKENAIPVLIAPPQVKPGGKVQVTVGAPNPDSVRSIEIFLQSPNGQVSRRNIWNINGEGQWFGHISIPEDAEPGTWKVATIEITDTQGTITPYTWGKEIFQTFLVQ